MKAETGIVFDIQRCSLHDGPGIRTTIFLKGCQLTCQWCHNPESIAFQLQLSYNPAQCVNCLACVRACDFDAHLVDEQGHHLMDFTRCTACGECVEMCQGNALRMIGSEMTVEEVMKEVLRDRAFYERSGGGITLSGGEPMMQLAFSKALLAAAKYAGIHTCLETNGAVPQAWYSEILPLVDLFLFDYKATDPVLHKQLTGSSNEQILQNLALLYDKGVSIILRCPLIPGVNDDTIHLDAIAALHKEYPRLAGIELMPYHNLGVAKSGHIGESAPLPAIKAATPEMQATWLTHLKQAGCGVARIS